MYVLLILIIFDAQSACIRLVGSMTSAGGLVVGTEQVSGGCGRIVNTPSDTPDNIQSGIQLKVK
jgi:hypothetical protein